MFNDSFDRWMFKKKKEEEEKCVICLINIKLSCVLKLSLWFS